jgi:YD repeat-containing protein
MAIRSFLGWLAVLFLQCLLGARVEAQNAPASCLGSVLCQETNQWWAVCVPPLPPGAFNCSSNGWAEECQIATYQCPAICQDCESGTPVASNPINLATGDTFITQSDLIIPGLGGGLSLSRTWHSEFPFGESVPTSGMFGGNWRSTYEDLIYVDPEGLVKYVRGTGGIWTLGLGGTGGLGGTTEGGWTTWSYSMTAPANGNVSLAYNASLTSNAAYWTLSFNTGEKRVFTVGPNNTCPSVPPGCSTLPTIGYLTSITDRNGNTTSLTYDGLNRLTTVADPASRHLYFSYAPSSNLVTGVSSDVGISLSYAYDSQGRLATVTKPDLTTVSFQYVQYYGVSLISAVLDTNGKVLESHTYDNELRGLTSSRAGGVDAVTITYPFLFLEAP